MAKRIAVINDEPDFIQMVTVVLEDEGYEVRSSRDGAQGIDLIKQWQPHLVLLDIRMRGLNGWQTLERLQSDTATRYVRVLIASGAVEEADAARPDLRARGHDFIALPFDLEDFTHKIRQMTADRP
ncbi:MAG: response regulator [Chloroflexota bacterium]